MKLKIVEKENFIDGVMKKENLLQADLGADKAIVSDLESHMKAVNARVERIKKEKQVRYGFPIQYLKISASHKT